MVICVPVVGGWLGLGFTDLEYFPRIQNDVRFSRLTSSFYVSSDITIYNKTKILDRVVSSSD